MSRHYAMIKYESAGVQQPRPKFVQGGIQSKVEVRNFNCPTRKQPLEISITNNENPATRLGEDLTASASLFGTP